MEKIIRTSDYIRLGVAFEHPDPIFKKEIDGVCYYPIRVKPGLRRRIYACLLYTSKIACLEGIAYHNGWITAAKLRELAQPMLRNQYGQYLLKLTDETRH